jgi:acetylxylan esterase
MSLNGPRLLTPGPITVVAVLQMGDPRHIAGDSYNQGTSQKNGLFPRGPTISCEKFAKNFRSYCDSGDTFCDGGIDVLSHLVYVEKYGEEAV